MALPTHQEAGELGVIALPSQAKTLEAARLPRPKSNGSLPKASSSQSAAEDLGERRPTAAPTEATLFSPSPQQVAAVAQVHSTLNLLKLEALVVVEVPLQAPRELRERQIKVSLEATAELMESQAEAVELRQLESTETQERREKAETAAQGSRHPSQAQAQQEQEAAVAEEVLLRLTSAQAALVAEAMADYQAQLARQGQSTQVAEAEAAAMVLWVATVAQAWSSSDTTRLIQS